jgi:hypothetical protein
MRTSPVLMNLRFTEFEPHLEVRGNGAKGPQIFHLWKFVGIEINTAETFCLTVPHSNVHHI